jgi:hypothetical protein
MLDVMSSSAWRGGEEQVNGTLLPSKVVRTGSDVTDSTLRFYALCGGIEIAGIGKEDEVGFSGW